MASSVMSMLILLCMSSVALGDSSNVDVSACASSNTTLVIDGAPITTIFFKQNTRINSTLSCNYTILLGKYLAFKAFFADNTLLQPEDYLILSQHNPALDYTITVEFNKSSNQDWHDFLPSLPVTLSIYITSNSAEGIWNLNTYTTNILTSTPNVTLLNGEVGRLLDAIRLDNDAITFRCSQTNCSPTLASLQLPADYKPFNEGDISFLNYYFFYVDDVFQARLSDYINLLSDPFFVHFEGRSNITIINCVLPADAPPKFNIVLLFSANLPNISPSNALGSAPAGETSPLIPQVIHLQEYGQLQLKGNPEAVFHMIAEQNYNPYSTSYIEDISVNNTDGFELLNVYANCALIDSYKTKLASVTPENCDEWRHLVLRGRCKTFYVRGTVTLNITEQYQGHFSDIRGNRSVVFVSDNYLSDVNWLEKDATQICFKDETDGLRGGIFRITLNSNDSFDSSTVIGLGVDGSDREFTGTEMKLQGKCLNISYEFPDNNNFGVFLSIFATPTKNPAAFIEPLLDFSFICLLFVMARLLSFEFWL